MGTGRDSGACSSRRRRAREPRRAFRSGSSGDLAQLGESRRRPATRPGRSSSERRRRRGAAGRARASRAGGRRRARGAARRRRPARERGGGRRGRLREGGAPSPRRAARGSPSPRGRGRRRRRAAGRRRARKRRPTTGSVSVRDALARAARRATRAPRRSRGGSGRDPRARPRSRSTATSSAERTVQRESKTRGVPPARIASGPLRDAVAGRSGRGRRRGRDGGGRPRTGGTGAAPGEPPEEEVAKAQDGEGGARIEAERREPRAGEPGPFGLVEEVEAQEEVGGVIDVRGSAAEGAARGEDVPFLDERREGRRLAQEPPLGSREDEGRQARVDRQRGHSARHAGVGRKESSSTAPRRRSSRSASDRSRRRGGRSNQPKSAGSRAVQRRTSRRGEARSVRRSSGSSKGRRPRSSCREKRRRARPGPRRPARPARCSALARGMRPRTSRSRPERGSKRRVRARPESTTVETPSIVSDVSATFVARMTRRRPADAGASAASCAAPGRSPWRTRTSRASSIDSTASRARRISKAPGRKTRTSPRGPSDEGGPHGRRDAGLERPRVGVRPTCRTSTGKGRPGTLTTGRRTARVREERGDGARVERGGGDEKQEVLAEGRADLAEHREGEVRVAAPLVELVEHHARDAGERGVLEEAAGQDPLGHDEDARPGRAGALVADLVAGALARPVRPAPRRSGAPRRARRPFAAAGPRACRTRGGPAARSAGGTLVVLPAPGGATRTSDPALAQGGASTSGRNGSIGSVIGTGATRIRGVGDRLERRRRAGPEEDPDARSTPTRPRRTGRPSTRRSATSSRRLLPEQRRNRWSRSDGAAIIAAWRLL